MVGHCAPSKIPRLKSLRASRWLVAWLRRRRRASAQADARQQCPPETISIVEFHPSWQAVTPMSNSFKNTAIEIAACEPLAGRLAPQAKTRVRAGGRPAAMSAGDDFNRRISSVVAGGYAHEQLLQKYRD
jgi:hypothetical protein